MGIQDYEGMLFRSGVLILFANDGSHSSRRISGWPSCMETNGVVSKKKSISRSQSGRERQDLRDLVSFKLRQLNNIYVKTLSRVYAEKFGLTINEWRLIALTHTADRN